MSFMWMVKADAANPDTVVRHRSRLCGDGSRRVLLCPRHMAGEWRPVEGEELERFRPCLRCEEHAEQDRSLGYDDVGPRAAPAEFRVIAHGDAALEAEILRDLARRMRAGAARLGEGALARALERGGEMWLRTAQRRDPEEAS